MPGYIDQNVFGLQRTAKKKMVITSWIVMQAHTNQPIERFAWHWSRHRHALPFCFFSLYFLYLQTHLHWFCGALTLNNSTKLKCIFEVRANGAIPKKKKKKAWQSCQARVVSCCPALLLFVFLLFFHIIQTKIKRRERSKSKFEKEWPKLIYVVTLL